LRERSKRNLRKAHAGFGGDVSNFVAGQAQNAEFLQWKQLTWDIGEEVLREIQFAKKLLQMT
jgi:septum formation inhibitor MinC